MRKSFWLLSLFVFVALEGCASLPVSPQGTRPIITNAFINKEKGIYGSILKIYVEAEDPKGFMFRIATIADQVGYGLYPTDWTYIERRDEHHLIGYLQWNTFSYNASRMPEWTQMTISVSIFDTDGNESNTVVFPFEFVSQAVPETPLPPPFSREKVPLLGYIDINLYNPLEVGEGEEFGPR